MTYIDFFDSPLGRITIASEENHLVGLWFDGQKYDRLGLKEYIIVDQRLRSKPAQEGNGVQESKPAQERNEVQESKPAQEKNGVQESIAVLEDTKRWLTIYFQGTMPDFLPDLKLQGSEFRKMVSEIMLSIPYGQLMTYGEIAKEVAKRLGKERMSAQAVGGAVGHNPISIIVPCHRVVSGNGSLTGYAGGIKRKVWLLENEGISLREKKLFVPQKGSAL